MVATRGRTFKRPWRRSCHSSKLKSSSAPIGRKDSWCFHAVGSSNAPLLGSTAAEGLQRIGRTSIATRWRSCGSPQSASCSENFVIPLDVFGQTLRGEKPPTVRCKRGPAPASLEEPRKKLSGICLPRRTTSTPCNRPLGGHFLQLESRIDRRRAAFEPDRHSVFVLPAVLDGVRVLG